MALTPLAESFEFCRNLTRRTAHNFRYSFLTLPQAERRAMDAFYAFNRITDDLGDDESVNIDERRIRLKKWRDAVQEVLCTGLPICDSKHKFVCCDELSPTHSSVLPAVADVVRRYLIPHEVLFAVIDGVEMDLNPVEIASFVELERYCYHVAGAVGIGCIHIWGFRDNPDVMPLAIQCGLALQLTNIIRDLAEDADRGRIYLPREDLIRFGYSAEDLRSHVRSDAFRELMRFEADRARSCYESGESLLKHLEPRGRPILRAMLDIYRSLLDEVVRRDFDVFTSRISLPKSRKLWLAGSAIVKGWLRLV